MKNSFKKYQKKLMIIIITEIFGFFLVLSLYFNFKNILVGLWLLLFILGILIPYSIGIAITIKHFFFLVNLKKEESKSLDLEDSTFP